MGKFSLLATVVPWVDVVKSSASIDYDAKADPIDAETGKHRLDPYDGVDALQISLSVGDGGRGSSRFEVTGQEIGDVIDILANYNPEEVVEENLSPAQIARRTLSREDDENWGKVSEGKGVVSFQLSLAKHTRSIRVPWEHWKGFVNMLDDTFSDETINKALNHYRGEVLRMQEAEKKKAAAAAAKAAAGK